MLGVLGMKLCLPWHILVDSKFSDLQIESRDENTRAVGIFNTIELFVDLISEVETYCRYDFDFVSETSKLISGNFLSDSVLTRNIPF